MFCLKTLPCARSSSACLTDMGDASHGVLFRAIHMPVNTLIRRSARSAEAYRLLHGMHYFTSEANMNLGDNFLRLHVPEPPGHEPNPPPTTPPGREPGREIDLPPPNDPDEVREPDQTPPDDAPEPDPQAPPPAIH